MARDFSGLQLFNIEVEIDGESDRDLIIVADTIEDATAKAAAILTAPPKHLLVDLPRKYWRTGTITKVQASGVIDG